jgi:hypothetical protein
VEAFLYPIDPLKSTVSYQIDPTCSEGKLPRVAILADTSHADNPIYDDNFCHPMGGFFVKKYQEVIFLCISY